MRRGQKAAQCSVGTACTVKLYATVCCSYVLQQSTQVHYRNVNLQGSMIMKYEPRISMTATLPRCSNDLYHSPTFKFIFMNNLLFTILIKCIESPSYNSLTMLANLHCLQAYREFLSLMKLPQSVTYCVAFTSVNTRI
jgi:hypothetical protein